MFVEIYEKKTRLVIYLNPLTRFMFLLTIIFDCSLIIQKIIVFLHGEHQQRIILK